MNFLGSFLSALKPRSDDDAVDRLNYYWTCLVLLVFSLTISAKQYVGQPIQCWVPAQFTHAWEQYAENYCFVQNTYWLPLHDAIPRMHVERDARQIGYYQWVPFVLAVEAVLFYVPCLLWRQLNWQTGINVMGIIKMAEDAQNVQWAARDKMADAVCRHLEDALALQRDGRAAPAAAWRRARLLLQFGKRRGVYVSLLYLFCKFLYLVNVIGQFFLLNAFLGPRYRLWGVGILNDLLHGREWDESGHFPRVTMCDFEVRVLGNLHRYTIQCVLMINMFNEKIFLFIWWWFLAVAVGTALNLGYWLLAVLSSSRREAFVRRYLRVSGDLGAADRQMLRRFVVNGLRVDGVVVLRMLANHTGDLAASELLGKLWRNFRARQPALTHAFHKADVDAKHFDDGEDNAALLHSSV